MTNPWSCLLTYCLNKREASSLAKPLPNNAACAHLTTDTAVPYPFDVEMVLDEQVGITDAIIRCRVCGQAYLIEMLDWSGPHRVQRTYRTSLLDDDVIDRYKRDRNRGSCDINRAGAEWQAVQNESRLTDLELTLDTRTATLLKGRRLAAATDIPMAHWRQRLR
jgi:hypothetical protein